MDPTRPPTLPPDARPVAALPSPWPGRLWRLTRSLLMTTVLTAGFYMLFATLRSGPAMPDLAPAFRAVALDGQPVELAALRGRPVVLYFWASWCPVCKVTTPIVNDYARRNPEVAVLGVAMEEAEAVRAYLGLERRHFTVVPENDEIVKAYAQVRALPTTIVLNREGRVAWSRSGLVLPFELDLRAP